MKTMCCDKFQKDVPFDNVTYRIAGYFRKVFIFGYFERACHFENKFPGQAVLRK